MSAPTALAASAAVAIVTPFEQRPLPKTLCLFDVDGTLTIPRQDAKPEIIAALAKLRQRCAIGVVGGSDLKKIKEQLEIEGVSDLTQIVDYVFAENGLTAFRLGQELEAASFIKWIGEDKYKMLVKFVLRYISELDIPIMRGTFIEFRNGMINVSPIGRNASNEERFSFEAYDKEHKIRAAFVEALRKEFGDWGLTFSIGGQISFDVFPNGWDKTYALGRIEKEGWEEIHFFGDKTYKGGNDYEIFEDSRTIGHTVTSPEDTIGLLEKIFKLSSHP
ncbi:Phosphomannomutase 1 [Tilletia horrida]|uniref:Phosphomannomutase n=1 Tax=Tilletia horrida TaxID=155126 RepID=A0AAN6GUY8_9BASI|nr:Phosphomannomutase 1 [Tilletia horrida]KAK0567353.1 Phosphomannomutase 1 [Tilletia horrida]